MRLEFESNASAFPLVETETVNESVSSEGDQLLRAGVKAAQEGRRSEAKALLLRVTEVEPENENAWLWLASISEYPEELLVFLNNVLRVNAENERAIEWKKATQSLLAKTLVQRGADASREDRNNFARQCFEQAVDHDAENELAWLWLASIAESESEKIGMFEKVLSINPENESALNAIKAFKSDRSVEILRDAVSEALEGNHAAAQQMLAIVLDEDDSLEEAWVLKAHLADSFEERAESLLRIRALNPENEMARASLASWRQIVDVSATANTGAEEFAAEAPQFEADSQTEQEIEPNYEMNSEGEEAQMEFGADDPSEVRMEDTQETKALAESLDIPSEYAAPDSPTQDLNSMPAFTYDPAEENHDNGNAEAAAPMDIAAEIEAEEHQMSTAFEDFNQTFTPDRDNDVDIALDAESRPEPFGTDEPAAADRPDHDEEWKNTSPELFYGYVPADQSFDAPLREEAEPFEAPADEPSEAFEARTGTFETAVEPSESFEYRSESYEAPAAEPAESFEYRSESYEAPTDAPADAFEAQTESFDPPVNQAFETRTEWFDTPVDEPSEAFEARTESFDTPVNEPNYENESPAPECNFDAITETMPESDSTPATEFVPEAAPAVRHELALCPFCNAETEKQAMSCGSCHAVLSLTDLDSLFNENGVITEIVQQSVSSFEREHESYGLNAEQLASLGIGHVNLKNYRQGFLYLQDAVRANPSNVVLDAQLNAFAIRLEEIEKLKSAHELMSKNRKILVVDDSPTVRKLISSKLEKCGHEVICAVDGLDALEKLNGLNPDLILLDITMPRMDGYQVCKLIRSNSEMKDVPIVMISGKDGFFDKVRGRMAGTTDYITKPFGPETLMKTVESYLN
jgi:twitching motility two-component system response regulator PilG